MTSLGVLWDNVTVSHTLVPPCLYAFMTEYANAVGLIAYVRIWEFKLIYPLKYVLVEALACG